MPAGYGDGGGFGGEERQGVRMVFHGFGCFVEQYVPTSRDIPRRDKAPFLCGFAGRSGMVRFTREVFCVRWFCL